MQTPAHQEYSHNMGSIRIPGSRIGAQGDEDQPPRVNAVGNQYLAEQYNSRPIVRKYFSSTFGAVIFDVTT